MEKILLDLQLAETYSLGLGDSIKNRFTKNKDSLAVFYQAVFAHHKVTDDRFIQAMNWYARHPGLAESLFHIVLDRLDREKARLNIASARPETIEVPAPGPDSNKLHKDISSGPERISDTAARLLTPRQKPETTP